MKTKVTWTLQIVAALIMGQALFFVGDDGGQLFGMAIVTLLAAAVVAWNRRAELPVVGCCLGACAAPEKAAT